MVARSTAPLSRPKGTAMANSNANEVKKTKYCRGCGSRLQQPDAQGNLKDGAYWKFAYNCLRCRLAALFLAHNILY
jgi:hypothetical protein